MPAVANRHGLGNQRGEEDPGQRVGVTAVSLTGRQYGDEVPDNGLQSSKRCGAGPAATGRAATAREGGSIPASLEDGKQDRSIGTSWSVAVPDFASRSMHRPGTQIAGCSSMRARCRLGPLEYQFAGTMTGKVTTDAGSASTGHNWHNAATLDIRSGGKVVPTAPAHVDRAGSRQQQRTTINNRAAATLSRSKQGRFRRKPWLTITMQRVR